MFASQTTSGINSDVFPETIVHKIWSLFNQWFYDTCVGVLQLSVFMIAWRGIRCSFKNLKEYIFIKTVYLTYIAIALEL